MPGARQEPRGLQVRRGLVEWRLPWRKPRKSRNNGCAKERRTGMSRASGRRSVVVRVAVCGFAGAIFPILIGIRAPRIRARADAEVSPNAVFPALAIAQQLARLFLTA